MLPKRLSAKFFATPESEIDLSGTFAVFQKWIQEQAVDDLLIDVVDYKHVYNGPGVILIGDVGDYGLDLAEGRPGLLYTQKRAIEGDLREAIITVIRRAWQAAELLTQEQTLPGLKFNNDACVITLLDRLNFPNTQETFEGVLEVIKAACTEVFSTDAVVSLAYDDPRQPFAVHVQLESQLA